MKSKHTFHTLAATAVFSLVTVFCGHGQTVQYLAPSSDFQPTGGGRAVLLDPFSDPASPNIFVGSIGSAYGEPTIFRLTPADSSFQQFTSEPVDAAMTTVGRLLHNRTDGALYAVGRSPKDPNSRNSPVAWTVRKSQDGGDTWANDGAPFLLDKNNSSWANGITTDVGGTVYVTGVGRDARSPHWMIRRKTPGGTWSTVFDVKNAALGAVGVAEVSTPFLAELELHARGHELVREVDGVVRGQHRTLQAPHAAADAERGRSPDREMDVRSALVVDEIHQLEDVICHGVVSAPAAGEPCGTSSCRKPRASRTLYRATRCTTRLASRRGA